MHFAMRLLQIINSPIVFILAAPVKKMTRRFNRIVIKINSRCRFRTASCRDDLTTKGCKNCTIRKAKPQEPRVGGGRRNGGSHHFFTIDAQDRGSGRCGSPGWERVKRVVLVEALSAVPLPQHVRDQHDAEENHGKRQQASTVTDCEPRKERTETGKGESGECPFLYSGETRLQDRGCRKELCHAGQRQKVAGIAKMLERLLAGFRPHHTSEAVHCQEDREKDSCCPVRNP
jgi:hypothetical protein